ncbi:MAG: DEAD/DEAH box helicase family protein [Kiritimatiellae bacterium]|nr:DEAD/DEAH box helicase family protein [Kiritimatiellia bacterium]
MKYEKRKYQEEAVGKCVGAFVDKKCKSVMLVSPVGSGKTYMALETIHRLQEKLGGKLRVNWVAPRVILLQQMMEANRDLYQDNIRPVSLFDRNPPSADLVVLDEAHHEATQTCVLLYEKMKNSMILGLSATPLRTDRMKLSFQETVKTCRIGRLIREGYLSPFNSYLLPKYTVESVAECYLSDPERWGKSIAFFSTILECNRFKELMRRGGVDCEVVTGSSDKELQLARFADGRAQIVANVAMLTEGFDQPDVQSVFARDGSRLPTIQMCGRGLRLAPGKEACNIVQSCETDFKFERVTPAKNAFRLQDGQWLALKDGTKAIAKTVEKTLALIAEKARKEKQEHRAEFAEARRHSRTYFEDAMLRVDEDEKKSKSYYRRNALLYRELYDLYQFVNVTCWGGQLPHCALHLNKISPSTSEKMDTVVSFTKIGDDVYPAIVLNVHNLTDLTPRQFAIALLHAMIHVWQMTQGRGPGHGEDFASEFGKIGVDEESNMYARDSMAEAVFKEVDQAHGRIVERLKKAGAHAFWRTKKGDARYFEKRFRRMAA